MTLDEIFNVRGVLNVALFGSRVVGCAKEGSDYDYLVLVKERPVFDSDWSGLGFVPDVEWTLCMAQIFLLGVKVISILCLLTTLITSR